MLAISLMDGQYFPSLMSLSLYTICIIVLDNKPHRLFLINGYNYYSI